MNTAVDVTLIGALAAVWLTAGLLADGLAAASTAHSMRRRAGLLTVLAGAGAALFVAVPVATALLPGASSAPVAALLPAVPAVVVLTAGLRKLSWVRRGAGAFATAPQAPVPPALRAAAAHPLIAAPLQATGLAAIVALPLAAGLLTPSADEVPATTGIPGVAGLAITVVAVLVTVIGIRAAIRHSRLAPLVLAPLDRVRQRARATTH
ncbi:hypothetical protein [Actinoplanes sp. SE50/110]|uniref:hypothetical protein n=1 Tax=Actinoplanes sp. (strain ATCC 31044 / CBS 674.73 / SE50/110) TaxID=134676 RepID=UPI0002E54A25|nr:hypothetical protein [Actinoplanes sp. SE50/110]SLL96858.1 hypothetical protein ACSP50_0045 [Actinoplanes sp. SE50/110]